MNIENFDYKTSVIDTRYLYKDYTLTDKEPRGFSSFDTTKEGESVLIKQNNTIISLLIRISEKLDNLNRILNQTKDPKLLKDLDDITNKLSGLELGKGTRKSNKVSHSWNFFQAAPVP